MDFRQITLLTNYTIFLPPKHHPLVFGAVRSLLVGICQICVFFVVPCHQASKDRHHHLGFDLHNIFWQSVHFSTHLPGNTNSVASICKFILRNKGKTFRINIIKFLFHISLIKMNTLYISNI